jgi:hypothetical protein
MLLWRTDLWNVKHASFVRKLLIAQYLAQLGLVRHSDTREEAFGLIRGLIDAVVLTPADGKLEIELRGDLAGILALSEVGKGKDFPSRALSLAACQACDRVRDALCEERRRLWRFVVMTV